MNEFVPNENRTDDTRRWIFDERKQERRWATEKKGQILNGFYRSVLQ